MHPGAQRRGGGVDERRSPIRKCTDEFHDSVVRSIPAAMPVMKHGMALQWRSHLGRPGPSEHDRPCACVAARHRGDLVNEPLRSLGAVAPRAVRTRPHHIVAVHEDRRHEHASSRESSMASYCSRRQADSPGQLPGRRGPTPLGPDGKVPSRCPTRESSLGGWLTQVSDRCSIVLRPRRWPCTTPHT